MIRRSTIAGGLIVGVFMAIGTPSGAAQTALATLRGIAQDEQGGALPGATITARQVDTNTVQTAVTSTQGQYFLPNLRPGRYELSAELQGFVTTRQQVDLRVGQDLTIGLTMKVGGVTEAVEIVGRSIAVETQSTRATVINNNQIDDLPTIARNFSALATLAPGTTTSNATGTRQGTGISISGQRPLPLTEAPKRRQQLGFRIDF